MDDPFSQRSPYDDPARDPKRRLLRAMILDGALVSGGAVAFIVTSDWRWLVAGVVAGSTVAIPAVLGLARSEAGQAESGKPDQAH